MDDEKFKDYLKQTQILAIQLEKNPEASKMLQALIQGYIEKSKNNPYYTSLLNGESFFYKKDYQMAFKHYSYNRKNTISRFLLFRAAAYIHYQNGNKTKAFNSAKRALKIFPEDYLVLQIYDLANSKSKESHSVDDESKSKTLIGQVESDLALKTKNIDFLLEVKAIHEALLNDLNYNQIDKLQEDPLSLKLYLLEQIELKIVQMKLKKQVEELDRLTIAVYDEMLGFGPIEPLLRDETITDIFINGPDSVYVEKKGKVENVKINFLSNDHIYRLVQRVASKSGRHLDLSTPYFDSQLPDGSRIHAIIPPVALDGIKVSLRKYQFQKLHINSLVKGGSLSQTMARFLQIAVQARCNIAICGGTGSGKTTLLNCLLASIGSGERIITIEDTPELEPVHAHTVRLLTRLANPEGKGAVTQADLMINALRMRPDRVILGELRGAEAFNFLHAMNTGQDGSLVTLHASGSEEVITRLLNMILMARYTLSPESIRQQIAGALDIIVYVARLVSGARRVMTISQVSSDERGDLRVEDIFRYDIEKISLEELKGKFVMTPIPPTKRNLAKLINSGLLKEYEKLFEKHNSD